MHDQTAGCLVMYSPVLPRTILSFPQRWSCDTKVLQAQPCIVARRGLLPLAVLLIVMSVRGR